MAKIFHKFDIGDEVQLLNTSVRGTIVEVKARTISRNFKTVIDPKSRISYRLTGDQKVYFEEFLVLINPAKNET
jgi:hypothetical protein